MKKKAPPTASTATAVKWSKEEEAILKKLMTKGKSFDFIASQMPSSSSPPPANKKSSAKTNTTNKTNNKTKKKKTADECRSRWQTHHTSLQWTSHEDSAIIALQAKHGNKWVKIAQELKLLGTTSTNRTTAAATTNTTATANLRSDNDVKNRWYCMQRSKKRKEQRLEELRLEMENGGGVLNDGDDGMLDDGNGNDDCGIGGGDGGIDSKSRLSKAKRKSSSIEDDNNDNNHPNGNEQVGGEKKRRVTTTNAEEVEEQILPELVGRNKKLRVSTANNAMAVNGSSSSTSSQSRSVPPGGSNTMQQLIEKRCTESMINHSKQQSTMLGGKINAAGGHVEDQGNQDGNKVMQCENDMISTTEDWSMFDNENDVLFGYNDDDDARMSIDVMAAAAPSANCFTAASQPTLSPTKKNADDNVMKKRTSTTRKECALLAALGNEEKEQRSSNDTNNNVSSLKAQWPQASAITKNQYPRASCAQGNARSQVANNTTTATTAQPVSWIGQMSSQLQQIMANTQKEFTQQQQSHTAELDNAQKQNEKLSKELHHEKKVNAEKDQEISIMQQQIQDGMKANAEKDDELTSMKEKVDQWKQQLENATQLSNEKDSTIGTMKQKLQVEAEAKSNLQTMHDKQIIENNRLKQELAAEKQLNHAKDSHIAEMKKDTALMKQQLEGMTKTIGSMKQQHEANQKENARLQTRILEQNGETKRLMEELAAEKEAHARLRHALKTLAT